MVNEISPHRVISVLLLLRRFPSGVAVHVRRQMRATQMNFFVPPPAPLFQPPTCNTHSSPDYEGQHCALCTAIATTHNCHDHHADGHRSKYEKSRNSVSPGISTQWRVRITVDPESIDTAHGPSRVRISTPQHAVEGRRMRPSLDMHASRLPWQLRDPPPTSTNWDS